jgi:head-tail adaptor
VAVSLRQRVDIEERVELKDEETGTITHTWEPAVLGGVVMLGVPAAWRAGPGREMRAAGTKLDEVTGRLKLRWFPGLRPDMRVVFEGEPMDIISIETDPTLRREYWLKLRAGVTDGA